MPDFTSRPADPLAGWHEAFAALPLEGAPADGWTTLSRRLDARLDARSRRFAKWPLPLAAAAVLALAVVPAWLPQPGDEQPAVNTTPPAAIAQQEVDVEPATLEQLHAESARLEALLQYARDGRVASGAAAMMAAEFDARITAVDAALMQPGISPERRMQLWRERVDMLRDFAGFESTRRWLAASGQRYDGALVHVD
jgi:hypothetical protein